MFDFKRLKELLRNGFEISNVEKLSLSGQFSVSYSKYLSNHTLKGVFHYKCILQYRSKQTKPQRK